MKPSLVVAAVSMLTAATVQAEDAKALLRSETESAAAADALVRRGAEAIPAILDVACSEAAAEFLSHNGRVSRVDETLARMGAAAAAALGKTLADERRCARLHAAAALAELGPGAAPSVVPLVAALHGDVAAEAEKALIAIGAPAATHLAPLLVTADAYAPSSSPTLTVRARAARILGETRQTERAEIAQALATGDDRARGLAHLELARGLLSALLVEPALAGEDLALSPEEVARMRVRHLQQAAELLPATEADARKEVLLELLGIHTAAAARTEGDVVLERLRAEKLTGPEASAAIGKYLVATGRAEEAERAARAALAATKHGVEECATLFKLLADATAWGGKNRRDEAFAVLAACETAHPRDARLPHLAATFRWDHAYRDREIDAATKARETELGLAAVGRALAIDPEHAEAHIYRAQLLRVKASDAPERQQAELLREAAAAQKRGLELMRKKSSKGE